MVIPASSTEFLHVPATVTGFDPVTAPVRIAVVAHGDNPATAEWQTAEWGDSEAHILIGPDGGALVFTRGSYRIWINVDPPGAENLVRLAGTLTIT
ncbi:hypothetical protein OG785_45630 [Streptomyces sp. NBC_00006]|uniref:hypothetical protein n=1 Tax=Streptomyces sp. NBC_00006 TaxID=2975619 RepID=UPI002256CD86|nr:hypothetical protein [Streptomyces sp. NBC_00006]MCX5537842.1 hypothetical protein [Streptomyces sp. NBC_00006]